MKITLKRHNEDKDMIDMYCYEGFNHNKMLMASVNIDCFPSEITESLYDGVDELHLELK